MNRLIGVNNVYIEPEKQVLVSLIWPSLILYNRVGNCSILASFTRNNGEKVVVPYHVTFDTSIDADRLPEFLISKLKILSVTFTL